MQKTPEQTTGIESVLRERRLDREDLEIQIEAAQTSVARGFYATAIAELRRAIMIIEKMADRCG
jgi:hypothetical protein